jgi:predicted alpha/beta-fold hydrolase
MEETSLLDFGYILLVLNRTNPLEFALAVVYSQSPLMILPSLVGIATLVYVLFYLCLVVHRPRIVSSNIELKNALTRSCSTLRKRYWPLIWAPQKHMQTVLRVICQSYPRVQRRRELFKFSDGGQAYLDWCGEDRSSVKTVVVVLPGITGSVRENYVCHIAEDVVGMGCGVVVFNYRGLGGARLSTPKLDCIGDCSDLKEVVKHVKALRPDSNLVLLGTSMGGIQIVSYLSHCTEAKEDPLVQCGLVVSVPWRMNVARHEMKHDILNRWIVGSYVAWRIRRILRRNKDVFLKAEEAGTSTVNYKEAVEVQSYEDIFRRITSPMFGFSSFEEYIDFSTSHLKLGNIKTPLICLSSEDDIYCPNDG